MYTKSLLHRRCYILQPRVSAFFDETLGGKIVYFSNTPKELHNSAFFAQLLRSMNCLVVYLPMVPPKQENLGYTAIKLSIHHSLFCIHNSRPAALTCKITVMVNGEFGIANFTLNALNLMAVTLAMEYNAVPKESGIPEGRAWRNPLTLKDF